MKTKKHVIDRYQAIEEKIIRIEMGKEQSEQIIKIRKFINKFLKLNDLEFEKEIGITTNLLLDDLDYTKSSISLFIEEQKITNEIDYIRRMRRSIRELNKEYQQILEKPHLLDYEYMRNLITNVLLLSDLLYKPTKIHKKISSELFDRINHTYTSRAYSKLDNEKKKYYISNWGTHVNNLFVLCGYDPVFRESDVSLEVKIIIKQISFWDKVKLRFMR